MQLKRGKYRFLAVCILGLAATDVRAEQRFGADAFAYQLLSRLADELSTAKSLSVDCQSIIETKKSDQPLVREDIRQRLLLERSSSFSVSQLAGSSPAPEFFFHERQANLVIPGAGIVSRKVRDLERFLRTPTFGFDRKTQKHRFMDINVAAALVRKLAIPQSDEDWDEDLSDIEISSISEEHGKRVFVIDWTFQVKDEYQTVAITIHGEQAPLLVKCESKSTTDGETVSVVGTFTNWNLSPNLAKSDFFPKSKGVPTVQTIRQAERASARHIHFDREIRATLIGTRLPDMPVTLIDGQKVTLEAYRNGRPMVIDFWASWCEPCVVSLPQWKSLLEQDRFKGIARLAINQGEPSEVVKEFVDRNGWESGFATDDERKIGSRLQVVALPQTVIVGANGRIHNVVFKGISKAEAEMEEELTSLLAPSQPTDSIDTLKEREKQVRRTSEKVLPAVVGVALRNGGGSGVIVSPDGLVLTAAHVTGRANQKVQIFLQNGEQYEATTLGAFHGRDAAMLKIDTDDKLPFVEVADAIPDLGEWVISVGHPGGFSYQRAAPVRVGRIVKTPEVRGVARGFFATDGLITQGDSGGPVFDLEGRVIGIHSFIARRMEENMHVPIGVFQANWERLLKGDVWGGNGPQTARRARIGVRLEKVDGQGVTVKAVIENSPADKAGIRVNDVVVQFGKRTSIDSIQEFQREISDFAAGDTIKMSVRRGDKEITLQIKLEAN